MFYLLFFALLLMISPFDNVFGDGDKKDRVTDESITMLADFYDKILDPLFKYCPKEEFAGNVQHIDKSGPKWFICIPVLSMKEAYNHFGIEIRREKLVDLIPVEDKRTIKNWASFTNIIEKL